MLGGLKRIFGGDELRQDIEGFQIGQKTWCRIKRQGSEEYYFEPVEIEGFDEKSDLFTVRTKTGQKHEFSSEELRKMQIDAAADKKGSPEYVWDL